MANEQNLKPITSLSSEEAKRRGSIGGKASVEARREKKIFKEEILKRLNASDFGEIVDNLIKRAKDNDKSFELLRDTMGQKPTDDIQAEIQLPITYIEVTDNSELKKKFENYEDNTETKQTKE